MPKILVTKAFRLTLSLSETLHFAVGEHEVAQEIADHMYTKAHCVSDEAVEADVPEPAPATVVGEIGAAIAAGMDAHAAAQDAGDNAKAIANAARRAADAARKARK